MYYQLYYSRIKKHPFRSGVNLSGLFGTVNSGSLAVPKLEGVGTIIRFFEVAYRHHHHLRNRYGDRPGGFNSRGTVRPPDVFLCECMIVSAHTSNINEIFALSYVCIARATTFVENLKFLSRNPSTSTILRTHYFPIGVCIYRRFHFL